MALLPLNCEAELCHQRAVLGSGDQVGDQVGCSELLLQLLLSWDEAHPLELSHLRGGSDREDHLF